MSDIKNTTFEKSDYIIVNNVSDYESEQDVEVGGVFEVLEDVALDFARFNKDIVYVFTHQIYAQGRVDGDEYNPKMALELLEFSEHVRKEIMRAYKLGVKHGVMRGE